MITNDGKQLIGKFLLSQAPSFATHIAAGIGELALLPDETVDSTKINEIKERKNMEFEVFRVPISAKGFVREDGVEKIVFKAEMPTEQRYQITEVAFFPAAENSVAGSFDSKTLATFVPTETWVVASNVSSSTINLVTSGVSNNDGDLLINDKAFFINSNESLFNEQDRRQRQEIPRFYNRALIVSGDFNYLDSDFTVLSGANYIQNSTLSFNLNQNLPPDEIKLAIALMSKEKANNSQPEKVRIIFDFVNDNPVDLQSSPKARTTIELDSTDFLIEENLGNGRPSGINSYKIITKKLSDFALDDTFSWANINLMRIYVSVIDEQTVTVTNKELSSGLVTLDLSDASNIFAGMSAEVSGMGEDFDGTHTITSASGGQITYGVSSSATIVSASASSGSVVFSGRTPEYKIIFDGLRLDNVSSQNPLYTMVGYDIIRNDNAYPVLKSENTNNYIEYRFGIGVT
jgi:hypothetical protein